MKSRNGLELACIWDNWKKKMWGVFLNHINLVLMTLPRMSLTCKLVPVQYREYKEGVLHDHITLLETGYEFHNVTVFSSSHELESAEKVGRGATSAQFYWVYQRKSGVETVFSNVMQCYVMLYLLRLSSWLHWKYPVIMCAIEISLLSVWIASCKKFNLFQALCQCERLKKRACDEWGLVGKKERFLLFSPGSRSPLIPLVARSLFRCFSLTESLEQASKKFLT